MAPPTIAEIIKNTEFKPELVQRIAFRDTQPTLKVVPYNPEWPKIFASIKQQIITALGNDSVIAVHHTGSTSIPDLPAKPIIDIDLVVRDITAESEYVAPLEAAGFRFLLREPHWHGHRFFYAYVPYAVNLHVWGPDSPEVVRHRIFRERILGNAEDKAAYVEAKMMAAEQIGEKGGDMQDYNDLKEDTIRKILKNAFRELGYIE